MTVWERLDLDAARDLLDFAGARPHDLASVAHSQLHGAVALYNRLADRRLVWLADEVGMGKTYVALGVAALLRHQNPEARVLFIVPSSRLQAKWIKEISLFTRSCVKQVDHRARTFQGLPARPLIQPARLFDLAAEMAIDADRDVLTTMSSFSFALGEKKEDWQEEWRALAALAPHLPSRLPDALVQDKTVFKRVYAAALNLVLPSFDLVICDESHNLRAGAGHGAARNATMAAALGGRTEGLSDLPWDQPGTPRVARLLCLTATPVERQYEELKRQAEVFGLERHPDIPKEVSDDIACLRAGTGSEDGRKDIARRYVIRRLQELRPHGLAVGEGLTKNQYRLEWRQGGVETYDKRLSFASDREKLMVALVQKRVVELLHDTGARQADGTFLPSFQMGMLSSFESFSETISNKVEQVPQPIYDGDEQTADATERQGIDSNIVDRICRSYRETFGVSPPHPKMDQVADQAARWAAAGDKTLVFVRRVRSTEELADKITQRLDDVLIQYVRDGIAKSLRDELESWIHEWYSVRHNANAQKAVATVGDDDDDSGGADSFFAWFFRGTGEEDHQVAAKLRRETFQRQTHPWSIFFSDNHVLWLFGDDRAALEAWAGSRMQALVAGVRRFMSAVKKPGPQHYFEAWQAAALALLAKEQPETAIGRMAHEAQPRLYPQSRKRDWSGDAQVGDAWLLRETFFTRLRCSELSEILWPGAREIPSKEMLADREVRRGLIGSLLRLGHSFVDLWLSAVNLLGGLTSASAETKVEPHQLADALLNRLRAQREAPVQKHNAWHELKATALNHRLLLDVNFSDVHKTELHHLSHYFQRHLSRQSPALAMHGGSKSVQALTQFRMPGYPLVLIATDVLQEGVDLHTFCARVLHYGIAHTSSATEQRTGRVDRIGSLVHRRFGEADDMSKLQIHYPHLMDSVEPLQLRALYRRMDLFLRLVHDGLGQVEGETSRVSLQDGMQQERSYPTPPIDRLKTAFDVEPEDLVGGPLLLLPDVYLEYEKLDEAIRSLLSDVRTSQGEPRWFGSDGPRRQPISITLRTRRDGQGAYIRVTSPVGALDLSDGHTASAFLRRQSNMIGAVVTIESHGRRKKPFVLVRCDMPLVEYSSPLSRLTRAVNVVAQQADELERVFSGSYDELALDDWES